MPVASVGDAETATLELTQEHIDQFAALTGDENPLHVNEAYAEEGLFGGRVAHGALTASVVSAALAALPGDIVYLSQNLEFENPVRPGETVSATAAVTEDLGEDRLTVEISAETDRQVLSGETTIISLPHE
ncbi:MULTISPECIES: MaoC/PaaZ C-terminal domain-containing protein [unclassified Haladaptatus]|uniref:MaoC/PaaZ C-terminal domain-containing protein n=1 Tax=unclassified Haladaptatus TaxID=2622732 RepID=UPI00209BF0C5|nr:MULTISPECIES: MaoC/PaaZ C-terminal domain-containing protein [unclassified Haladaptatus]MCO8245627.1 MaoC family dehydratase N-terminal domain-containing protein [Haladaptatus sp. AB643]MCO8255455.1 MaoC family dehydratase N-terminal domain-containing protein [Haladaptatus sp. AB618]